MDRITFILSPGGGSYFPGLIMPAAVMLVAVLSAATVIYLTRIRPGTDDDADPLEPRDRS